MQGAKGVQKCPSCDFFVMDGFPYHCKTTATEIENICSAPCISDANYWVPEEAAEAPKTLSCQDWFDLVLSCLKDCQFGNKVGTPALGGKLKCVAPIVQFDQQLVCWESAFDSSLTIAINVIFKIKSDVTMLYLCRLSWKSSPVWRALSKGLPAHLCFHWGG